MGSRCYPSAMGEAPRDRPETADSFAHTRSSLFLRLADWNDRRAWMRFHDTYWPVIYAYAKHSGLSHEEALDVVQETIFTVARQMTEGQFDRRRGTFKSWLRNLTRWKIQDQFRCRDRRLEDEVHGAGDSSRLTATFDRFPAQAADPEAAWDNEWRQAILAEAMTKVKEQISPRQYQIFECHVLKGWDTAKVCRELGVTRIQVYLAKNRIQPLVRRQVEKIEHDGLF